MMHDQADVMRGRSSAHIAQHAASRQTGAAGRAWTARDAWALVAILAAATVLRAALYTGFLGSDEVTYLQQGVASLETHGQAQRRPIERGRSSSRTI